MKKTAPTYCYQWLGISIEGHKIRRYDFSLSKKHLKEHLIKRDIIPLKITLITLKTNTSLAQQFTQQLVELLNSNIHLSKAIELIGQATTSPSLEIICRIIHQTILQGQNLATALGHFPTVFDECYCNIIAAGEQSGRLSELLQEINRYQTRQAHAKQQFKKALFYPLTVAIIAFFITTGLLTLVVPQFAELFRNSNTPLPLFTAIIISASTIIRHNFLLLASSITLLTFLLKKTFQQRRYKQFLFHLAHKLPFIKILYQNHILCRWTMILTTTLSANLPLLQALSSSKNVMNDLQYQHKIDQLIMNINNGQSLYKALKSTVILPLSDLSLIKIAEASGQIPDIFDYLQRKYESHIDSISTTMSKLIEPIIMIVLAVIIGSIVIALYLPMLQMGTTLT